MTTQTTTYTVTISNGIETHTFERPTRDDVIELARMIRLALGAQLGTVLRWDEQWSNGSVTVEISER